MIREQLICELLEAAWLRVEHGPFERERPRGPFDAESLGGSAALAAADLVACERQAHTQEPPAEDASVEVLLDTPLARHAADAASSLIALARALAYAIGQPRTASREGLALLVSKAAVIWTRSASTRRRTVMTTRPRAWAGSPTR